jgi:hypothetical protein
VRTALRRPDPPRARTARPAPARGRAALALLACLAAGCSASRPLRPLPPGAFAAELSAPGLWARTESATFPVGTLVVGVRRGLSRDVEVALRAHPLLLATGILGLEGAATWHATPARGVVPALHLGGTLSTLASPRHAGEGPGDSLRGALALDVTAHWEPHPRLWPYVVVQNALVLADARHVASAFVGAQARLAERWDLSLEAGVAALDERTRDYTMPYLGVGGRGVLAMSWSLGYRW